MPCGYLVPRGKLWCDACGSQPPQHVSAVRQTKPPASQKAGSERSGGGGDKGKGKQTQKIKELEGKLRTTQKELEAAKNTSIDAALGTAPPNTLAEAGNQFWWDDAGRRR